MKVVSPIDGEMKLLNDVNDEAFASKMMGDGIAVTPSNGIVYAPVSGEITMLFPTNHALGIKTKEGVELLIHIGIDTVELNGRGFTGLVKQGDVVDIGDKLIEFDVDLIKNSGYEILTASGLSSSTGSAVSKAAICNIIPIRWSPWLSTVAPCKDVGP